jgi:MFS family permease
MTDTAVSLATPQPPWTLYTDRQRWGFVAILFLTYTSNVFDRNVISVLLEPIRQEFHASDTMLGVLGGFSFTLFNALLGIPIARWADRGNRPNIITLALALWSLMTVCCGLAASMLQLIAGRVGVGVGEAGAVPPAQSLIADYFPPERRANAFAVYTSGAVVGYLLSFGAGGSIAAAYGWRSAFLWAGAPGLALALITWLWLREPRRALAHLRDSRTHEALRVTLKCLWAKRSYVFIVTGSTLYYFVAYGALVFVPSFAIRVLHIPLARVSVSYGIVYAAASLIGTLGGGALATRLSRHDSRWLAWLAAVACPLAAPFYIAAFATSSYTTFLMLLFVGATVLIGGLPPAYAAIQSVCGPQRRAMAVAITFFCLTLIGGGFGPITTGAISDALSATQGTDSLRYAMMMMMSVLLITGWAFYAGGRSMPADLED